MERGQRVFTVALALWLAVGAAAPLPGKAAREDGTAPAAVFDGVAEPDADAVRDYAAYRRYYRGVQMGTAVLAGSLEQAVDGDGNRYSRLAAYEGVTGAVLDTGDSLCIPFTVETGGFYEIGFAYYALPGKGIDIGCTILVDGALPFQEAAHFRLSRLWQDERTAATDAYFERDAAGDEIVPTQTEATGWQTARLRLTDGSRDEAVPFFFAQGTHTVTITLTQESCAIAAPALGGPETVPDYAAYLAAQAGTVSANSGVRIPLEAERSDRKSSNGLAPYADRSTPDVTPNDARAIRVNAVGGYSWRRQGQWISWKVDVPAAGPYTLTFHYQQADKRGMDSIRALYVDGELPYREMAAVPFAYGSGWQTTTFADDGGTPYTLYLSEGEHTIRMEVRLGEAAPLLEALEETVTRLNAIYRDILMITGSDPDLNRDYYLDREIPGLLDGLTAARDTLRAQIEQFYALSGDRGSEASYLQVLIDQLEGFLADPRDIPRGLTTYRSNITSLADILLGMKEQPLALDRLVLTAADTAVQTEQAGFLSKLAFRFQIFLHSFAVDYATLGAGAADGPAVKIWVSQNDLATSGVAVGRDQAQLIQKMIRTRFTPATGIHAELSLVNSGAALIQSIVSGTHPDVVMFTGEGMPVTLAVRGAAEELSGYDGFGEVYARFAPSAFLSFAFDGGYYAVPDIQMFYLTYYRADILARLGLAVPQTWEEFYTLVKRLQNSHLGVGVAGGDQTIFETLLFQRGADLYNADLSATRLTETRAVEAFTAWTQLYTHYGLDVAFDFLSRFRSGEMPLGIMPLTMVNTLAAAAPEISGLWAIAPIPGVRGEDGTVTRRESCAVTGTLILKKARRKADCFRFLDWWTSAEVQTQFGIETEATLGASNRYFTANQEAFYSLPWTAAETQTLRDQWKDVTDVAQTPASYYVSRCLTNAFRNVVYYNKNPREILTKYAAQMDDELRKKRREFGLDVRDQEG